MVRIMDFFDEIGDGELELMEPQATSFVARGKLQSWSEIKKNIGHLSNHNLSGFQEWRCERRVLVTIAVYHCEHPIHAARSAGHIVIARTRILERKPDEFTTPLNLRPIKQLIAHEIILAGAMPALAVSVGASVTIETR